MHTGPAWLDQPDFEKLEGLCHLHLHGCTSAQVAKVQHEGQEKFIVTTGTLFGSQTILLPNAEAAFHALALASEQAYKIERSGDKPVEPVSVSKYGWTILPNKETSSAKDQTQEVG
jgi:hypothetical protein